MGFFAFIPTPFNALIKFTALSSALDIFGDKWSLVLIRDFFAGKTTYAGFTKSPEKIFTNILASRLKQLEEAEIVSSGSNNEKTGKAMYELTRQAESLYPVIDAISN